jgi:hypothetical protein
MNPDQDYNTFSFTRTGARFEKAFFDDKEPDTKDDRVISKLPVEKVTTNLVKGEARPVFDYLSKSFSDDYRNQRLAIEQSGWRTRVAIDSVE